MMGTKEEHSIRRKHYCFESPLVPLGLTVKGENYFSELPSDLIDINSPLDELARRHFYFFFSTTRLAYASIPVFSLISPSHSISRQISDSELFMFGSSFDFDPFSACDEISDSVVPEFGSGSRRVKLYSGGKLYRLTGGTLEPNDFCHPLDDLYEFCTRMSYVVYRENIFMIGGVEGFNCPEGRQVFSTRALRFNKTEFNDIWADLDSYRISEMNSGKGDQSIALEHKGILYVLANSYTEQLRHTFESYDIENDRWKTLNPPPIHMRGVPRPFREIHSYAVMDDKIYVSTERDAYVYDISLNEWNSCSLFDIKKGLFDSEEELELFPSKLDPSHSYSLDFNDSLKGGPPFVFDGEGIYFDNKFLICMSVYRGLVLAYFVNSERVKGYQILCYLPELPKLDYNYYSVFKVKWVGLGNGFFCATYYKDVKCSILVLVVFHISRQVEPANGKPLSCRICCRHEIGLASFNDWGGAFCFAM